MDPKYHSLPLRKLRFSILGSRIWWFLILLNSTIKFFNKLSKIYIPPRVLISAPHDDDYRPLIPIQLGRIPVEWDKVPSRNRVPVTCRWDILPVKLSSGMSARTSFMRLTREQCGMSILGKEDTYAALYGIARAANLCLTR